MRRAHVIGAGLAGLAAAVELTRRGWRVTLSEASAQAGGRCRSYHDPRLGCTIDNGNHLVLSGNTTVLDYCETIGSRDRLTGQDDAAFPFVDLRDDGRWTVQPNRGSIPWWLLSAARRVPGTRPADYLALARLMRARPEQRIGDLVPPRGPLWERLLEPLLISALNTPPAEASAALAGAVLRETLARGGGACRPLVAEPTLAAAFVDPALAWLERHGAAIRTGRRLRAIAFGDSATALDFADGSEMVGSDDRVVLAVPAWAATELVPGLAVPTEHHAIVNAHFLGRPALGAPRITGVVGGTAEWVFAFADRWSVTVSAADRLLDEDRDTLAVRLWADVARVHRLPVALPPWQIVREKRATFAATPAQEKLRPESHTRWPNLLLAGDWTRTGLPATIEGALRSGKTAAALAMGS